MSRKFDPGELLVKAGSKNGTVYILDSGTGIVNLSRENISELFQVHAPLVIGEEEVFGANTAPYSVLAVEVLSANEYTVDELKSLVQKTSPQMQMILKGLSERLKTATNELKAHRSALDTKPCPANYTAKIFGVIYHAARTVGKKNGLLVDVQWSEFKDYAVGMMEESEYRVRQALNILAKLGYVELDYKGKGVLQFTDMSQIEAFFEFYQNYHFKGGYAQLLKTNDNVTAITKALLKVAEPCTPDRMGVVRMPFKPAIDSLKQILGKSFEADHLFRLEQKGLMIKRIADSGGGVLSFWKAEFEQMLLNWKVLREVELWNEKGFVDMSQYVPGGAKAHAQAVTEAARDELIRVKEKLASWQPLVLLGKVPTIRTEAAKPGELLCSVCMTPHIKKQKICEVCDSDIQSAA